MLEDRGYFVVMEGACGVFFRPGASIFKIATVELSSTRLGCKSTSTHGTHRYALALGPPMSRLDGLPAPSSARNGGQAVHYSSCGLQLRPLGLVRPDRFPPLGYTSFNRSATKAIPRTTVVWVHLPRLAIGISAKPVSAVSPLLGFQVAQLLQHGVSKASLCRGPLG